MTRHITALSLLAMTATTDASPESEFWDWFLSNKSKLEAAEKSDSPLLEELSGRLKAVHEDLAYGISMHDADEHEFILSGDGMKEMIPVVREVSEAAPPLMGWKVIAFRPRMENYSGFTLEFGHRKFDPGKIWFHANTAEGHFDLILYHPDYSEDQRNLLVNGTYILLDMALGEYDVMTKVRYIDHQALPDDPGADGLLPFSKLRTSFDAFQKLETGRDGTGRPPTAPQSNPEKDPKPRPESNGRPQ